MLVARELTSSLAKELDVVRRAPRRGLAVTSLEFADPSVNQLAAKRFSPPSASSCSSSWLVFRRGRLEPLCLAFRDLDLDWRLEPCR